MKPLNIAVRLMAIATLSIGAVSVASATTDQIATASSVTGATFKMTSGTLTTTSPFTADLNGDQTSVVGTFQLIGGVTQTAAATYNGLTTTAGFSGGSFELKSGATDLLSGTFTSSDFVFAGPGPASSASLELNGITYDPGTVYDTEFQNVFGAAPGPGTGSLSFSGTVPDVTVNGSGAVQDFTAPGFGGTFDATASVVPETNGSILMLAALAPFAIVGMLLRRKSSGSFKA